MRERCPGQDTRYMRPEDVHETPCPTCGGKVEFFRDDLSRKCPDCGTRFRNPKLDLRCAKWCPFAKECIDYAPDDESAGPVP